MLNQYYSKLKEQDKINTANFQRCKKYKKIII